MHAAAGVSRAAAGSQWGGLLRTAELPEQMPGQPHLASTGHSCGYCAHIAGEPSVTFGSSAKQLSLWVLTAMSCLVGRDVSG